MNTALSMLVCAVIFTNCYTQDSWELVANKNDIRVFTKKVDGSDYLAFKAVMSIDFSEDEIIRILKNVGDYPNWFAFTASAKLIEQTETNRSFLMETDYPWPYSNECMIYRMTFLEKQNNVRKITIFGADTTTTCDQSLKQAHGYILLEAEKGKTKITYYFHSEPSQDIPTWLINPLIHEMPYRTFLALREKLSSFRLRQ